MGVNSDGLSCFDLINFKKGLGMSLVMNIWNEHWLPTFPITYCLAVLRMGGREVTCLSAFSSACSSCNQTIQQNFIEVLPEHEIINYIRPSVRYVGQVFEELGVRNGLEQ